MHPVIAACPICHDHLHVTQLRCRQCDTRLDGHFTLGRLYQLTPDQLDFVETFVRCEGKIKRVEQEMAMSYPAVRARLTEVIEALGYEVGESSVGPTEEERRHILTAVAQGTISAEEAIAQLRG